MNNSKTTRKELYDLVWSIPMTTLSMKYLISDDGLRKICKKMNIPLPKAGYWEKLRANKKVIIEELPSNHEGIKELELSLISEGDNSNSGPLSQLLIRQNEIESDLKVSLSIPDKLISPDPLILAAKASLITKKGSYSRYIGVVSTADEEIDIRVAPENVGRSVCFMDVFIKALKARGHFIKVRNGLTYVLIEGQEIKISFKEKLKKVIIKERWERTEYHASGILSFRMEGYNGKEWKDGKQSLENQLSKIFAKLELEGKRKKAESDYYKKQRIEREKAERINREFQKMKKEELEKFTLLLAKAKRLNEVIIIRNYIKAVEESDSIKNSTDIKKWISWANKKADWYDPLIEASDDLLYDEDREEICKKPMDEIKHYNY